MDGAQERDRRERALVWWGAMLPHMKTPPKFNEFVHGRRAASVAQAAQALDRIDQALMRKQ
jgi:hypothetical protein